MKHLVKSAVVVLLSLVILSSCDPKETIGKVIADFEWAPESPKVNSQVVFTSKLPTATSWEWDFGDGSTGSGMVVKHTYTQAGTYSVTHTVISDGTAYSKKKTVVVTTEGGGTVGDVVKHSKNITADETWSNKYVHLVTNRIEVVNATLTIEPGTIIKFKKDARLLIGDSQMQNSKLIAKGTPDKRILFTSASSSPKAGDWYYIWFGEFGSPESIMEYCDVMYAGGYSNYSGAVQLEKKNITFNHNTITQSEAHGIVCDDDSFFQSFEGNIIKDCKGNTVKIHANYAHTLGTEKGERSQLDNNCLHGIWVYGNLNITKGNVTWQNLGARYTIGGGLNIGSTHGTTLTIEKGTTIAFMKDARLLVGDEENRSGKLIAKGEKGQEIKFISEKVGNAGGDWRYIWFGKFAMEGSVLDHCVVESAGGYAYYSASIVIEKAIVNITNSVVKDSKSQGVLCKEEGHFGAFENNTIMNSAGTSIRMGANWAHTIGTGNNIANDGFGIAVTGDFYQKQGEFHWLKQTSPYTVVDAMDIGSRKGCTLVIDAGNTIQVAQDDKILVGDKDNTSGKLIAKGTPTEKIIFKSATPTGTWNYIWFGQGTMAGSVLENCEVHKAGSYANYSAAVAFEVKTSGTPTVRNCLIKDSESNGLYVNNGNDYSKPNVDLKSITFENNKGSDVYYNYKNNWKL